MSMECPEGYVEYDGKCQHCGSSFFDYRQNGPHMSVYCVNCGRHITFVPKFNLAEWKKAVKERDMFICQRCKMAGNSIQMQAHHKMPVWFMPELQYDLDNGITLCRRCHKQLHGVSGTIKKEDNNHAET